MNPTSHSSSGQIRLPELCNELFAFALTLRTAKDPGDAEQLTATIARLLEQLSTKARSANVDSAHLDAARYAICALLDETVLGSRWEIRSTWMNKPLQMTYYGDFTAGEQFYQRLQGLRGDFDQNVDAIEVYAQCLAAGFRGKYADLAGMQKADDLLAELGAQIAKSRGLQNRNLSKPHSRSSAVNQSIQHLPVWVVLAACAGVLLVILVILNLLLASEASEFLAPGYQPDVR
jgi:type VI secretion system protein ImpK